MRVAEADILIVPGFGGGTPEIWYARWQAKLSTARRVEQDWQVADRQAWTGRIAAAVAATSRPVVIVAHSTGAIATVCAAPRLGAHVAGAYLVAPSDWDRPDLMPGVTGDFAPIPMRPLPFPSVVVASSDDPYCSAQRSADFAEAWASDFVDAGAAGHINAEAGYGPWPEGLMRLAGFLSKLAPTLLH